jgi:hypothetical protein
MKVHSSDFYFRVMLSLIVLVGMASAEVTPGNLEFRRQATQRMIFDRDQEIPLAGFHPSKVIALDLMHPLVGTPSGEPQTAIQAGKLEIRSIQASRADRWIGGFNPSPPMISR